MTQPVPIAAAPGHEAPAEQPPPSPPSPSPPPPARARARASLEWLLAHRRAQALAPMVDPLVVLVAGMALFVAIFGVHIVWRHDRFGTFDHDLGIWDQGVWLLAHGRSLITVRGLNVFGFHASPALYLLVPFYRLGAGPNFLNLAMVTTMAAGALPVFRAARHHLANEWQALVPALAFLANYAGQWMMWETFHPEVMALTFLLFAYLAAVEGRWRAYAFWMVVALAWKEDVSLAGLMLGVVLAVRGRRSPGAGEGPAATRRAGLWTIALCLAWFVVATRLLIPMFSSGGNFTEALFGDLGSTPTEIARTAVTDPALVRAHLDQSNVWAYAGDLLASYGYVPVLSPLALLTGLPQVLINLLAVYDFFWTTKVHYAAMPLFATTVAAVEGVARARRPGLRRFLLGLMAVGAFYTALTWGLSPASPDYRKGYWPLTIDRERQEQLERAVALPGPDDDVSAVYNVVPHVTHREGAYTFPNPWVPSNWGVDGENRPDPDKVDWIILDPSALPEHERGILLQALREPGRLQTAGEAPPAPATVRVAATIDPELWRVVVDDRDLLVVQRQR